MTHIDSYLQIYLIPAGSNTWAADGDMNDATATGIATFDAPAVFFNSTLDDIRSVSPSFTTTIPATTDETVYTWAAANHDDTSGSYYVEVDVAGVDEDILLIGGVAILKIVTGNLILDDGTNQSSVSIAAGEHQIEFTYGSGKMQLTLDGTPEPEVNYAGFPTGDISTKATIRKLERT